MFILRYWLAVCALTYAALCSSAARAETPDPPPVTSAASSSPAPSVATVARESVMLPADDSEELTYAQALARAVATGKPLAIWVGGDFCPRCVRETSDEFVHYFTDAFPGVTAPAIVVGVRETPASERLVWVETVDWWIEGDKEFGHSPTIRGAVRRWLERRATARLERKSLTHTHIPASIAKSASVQTVSAPVVTYSVPYSAPPIVYSYPRGYAPSYAPSYAKPAPMMWSGSYGVSAGGIGRSR